MVTAYCVKCKEKGVNMENPEIHMTSRGGFMAKGKHAACGSGMSAIMSRANAEAAIASGDAKKSYTDEDIKALEARKAEKAKQ